MRTVKVSRNVWGNYGCFTGATRTDSFGDRYDATGWLSGQIEAGARLSQKSEITLADVNAHRARLGQHPIESQK